MSRFARFTMALALVVSGSASKAEPFELQFLPPEIDAQDICIARVSDEEMVKAWRDWSGGPVLGDDPKLMKRDLRRLVHIDPVGWYDTIEAGFQRLRLIDPKYTENHLLLDQIELRLVSGRLNEVVEEGMVERLLDRVDGLSPRFQNAAARFLIEGVGVPEDRQRGLAASGGKRLFGQRGCAVGTGQYHPVRRAGREIGKSTTNLP